MKLIFVLGLFFCLGLRVTGQNPENPKLVVGVVVDQMRYEYLDRYFSLYGEGGFKKLLCEGYSFNNNHIDYLPTSTASGHASIYTGTGPVNHGIIGNKWFDRNEAFMVGSVTDESVTPVGVNSRSGQKSPHRMKSNTVADENRLRTQMRGKTIGISLKDRAAILSAGHTANAAYWFDGKEGKFITSSFYMNELPQWVDNFNNSNTVKSYLKTWNTVYHRKYYTSSGKDINNFEQGFKGKQFTDFPYDLEDLSDENGGFKIIGDSPFGTDLTLDFTLAAISAEGLGTDEHTDFLTLSISSTDKVGHNFGANSKELQDTFIRLDANISKLLEFLDQKVGKGEYLLFLTSDHGSSDEPSYLNSLNMQAGYFDLDNFSQNLENRVNKIWGDDFILEVTRNQVYVDYDKIEEEKIDFEDLENFLALYILQQDGVNRVYTRKQLSAVESAGDIARPFKNGFNPSRSGDVFFLLDPAIIPGKPKKGSAHSSGYSHDTHVPLIFYGMNIDKGGSFRRTNTTDIAPTVSALLGIPFPNSTTGNPLPEILDIGW